MSLEAEIGERGRTEDREAGIGKEDVHAQVIETGIIVRDPNLVTGKERNLIEERKKSHLLRGRNIVTIGPGRKRDGENPETKMDLAHEIAPETVRREESLILENIRVKLRKRKIAKATLNAAFKITSVHVVECHVRMLTAFF